MIPESSVAAILARLDESEPVQLARRAIADPTDVWIVGGAIRDAALGRQIVDLDLATGEDPRFVAGQLAAAAKAAVFELSGEHRTWRVQDRRDRWWIDLAALRGDGIEADLRVRDFTVNAVASPLAGGDLIDPTGGLVDLGDRILRPASAGSFDRDPLRLMRAARLSAEMGLTLHPGLPALAAASVGRAAEPAGERIFAELRATVTGADPLAGLEILEELGVAAVVLPELVALRGVIQNANHHLDVHDHTVEVLRRLLGVEADLDRYAGEHADAVGALLRQPLGDGMSRAGGLRFAAVLHDVGKPATRREVDGFVRFKGHDRVGAEILTEICRRFRTSSRTSAYLSQLTRDHLILGFMVREGPLPRRRVWEYLKATEPWSIDVTLLTVADRLSARGSGVPEAAIKAHLDLAREMLADALAWELEGPPVPLMRGDELGEALGLEPGVELGRMLREQEAALYSGEVRDRDELLAHLRALPRPAAEAR